METATQSSPFASTMGIPDDPKDAIETIDLSKPIRRNDYDENDDGLFEKARREDRKTGADEFREDYIFGRCMDQKTCIWRGDHYRWPEALSSGITWVGVHGNVSICVVTKAGVLDVTRVHGSLQFNTAEDVEPLFRRAMISEMEDLADPASKPHEMRDKSINKPFGVVSVVPVTNKVHDTSGDIYEDREIDKYKLEYSRKLIENKEVSSDDDCVDLDTYLKNAAKGSLRYQCDLGLHDSDEDSIWFLKDKLKMDAASPIKEAVQESSDMCDEKGAIEFLANEMKQSAEHFTKEKTIKTAISAFQRLFKNKKLEAKEIGVCVMDPNYWVPADKSHLIDPYVQHLEEEEKSIENYLSDMSEPESEGSCSSATAKRLKCYA